MAEENVTRKLTAILYADVAGYSRLTGEDEVDLRVTFSSDAPLNVRFWLIADISKDRELGPLYHRKRTFARQSKNVC